MVYAYDQWAQLPIRDLYDSLIMAMAINAAKDMYEKGQAEMKEFQKEYGDFMTPISADLDWWLLNVNDPVRNTINAFYELGIDPLRNPQARSMISKLINSMPYGDMAFKKLRAKNAEEYYKNMATLRANDKYNEDYSKWLGEDPSQWATNFAGVTSPSQFQTLKEATNDWYNNRTPRDLTPEEKKALGLDPRYTYTGYFDSDLMNVAKGLTPGWQGSPISGYYRELAKRKLLAAGVENPTAEQVEAVLLRDIANAQQEWLVGPTQGKADEFMLDDHRTANDIKANRAKADTDYYYSILPYADTNGDGKLSNEERASYAKLLQLALSGKGKSSSDSDSESGGYNIAEDVYATSLAKGSGMEYFPQEGIDPNLLSLMLKGATKKQIAAINSTGNVLTATGMFIAPEKVAGLIQSDGKNGRGYFLNPSYFKNLHELDNDIRSSFKGWKDKTMTSEESKQLRALNKQLSKDIVSGIRDWDAKQNKNKEWRLKVVPTSDDNHNNVYAMVGDDGKWHTYALVRVYMSDGKKDTKAAGEEHTVVDENGKEKKVRDIPEEGRLMALEVGLHSNEGKASPDLSISAREDLGYYGYDATTKQVGRNLNSGFPYSTNILKHN